MQKLYIRVFNFYERYMTLTKDMKNDLFVAEILSKSKTLAMVGSSQNWIRPSNFVTKYLQKHGYKVIPVNPKNTGENALEI